MGSSDDYAIRLVHVVMCFHHLYSLHGPCDAYLPALPSLRCGKS
jgi:hypothetical protein